MKLFGLEKWNKDDSSTKEDDETAFRVDLNEKDPSLEGGGEGVISQIMKDFREGRGDEVLPEDMELLLQELAEKGLESTLANEILRTQGFKSWSDALSQFGLTEFEAYNPNTNQIELLEQLAEDAPTWFKDVAKRAAISGGVSLILGGLLSLAIPVTIPILMGAGAGGLIGRISGRVIGEWRKKRKLKSIVDDDGYTLSENALSHLVETVVAAQHAARQYMEVEGADEWTTKKEILGSLVDSIHGTTLKEADEVKALDKSSRIWEAAGAIIGSIAGGIGANLGEAVHRAYSEGIQLSSFAEPGKEGWRVVGENTSGHTVKYIDGAWHWLANQGDISRAHEGALSVWHAVSGGSTVPHEQLTQTLLNNSPDGLMHVSDLATRGVVGAVKNDALLQAVQKGGLYAFLLVNGINGADEAVAAHKQGKSKNGADIEIAHNALAGIKDTVLPETVRPTSTETSTDTTITSEKVPEESTTEAEGTSSPEGVDSLIENSEKALKEQKEFTETGQIGIHTSSLDESSQKMKKEIDANVEIARNFEEENKKAGKDHVEREIPNIEKLLEWPELDEGKTPCILFSLDGCFASVEGKVSEIRKKPNGANYSIKVVMGGGGLENIPDSNHRRVLQEKEKKLLDKRSNPDSAIDGIAYVKTDLAAGTQKWPEYLQAAFAQRHPSETLKIETIMTQTEIAKNEVYESHNNWQRFLEKNTDLAEYEDEFKSIEGTFLNWGPYSGEMYVLYTDEKDHSIARSQINERIALIRGQRGSNVRIKVFLSAIVKKDGIYNYQQTIQIGTSDDSDSDEKKRRDYYERRVNILTQDKGVDTFLRALQASTKDILGVSYFNVGVTAKIEGIFKENSKDPEERLDATLSLLDNPEAFSGIKKRVEDRGQAFLFLGLNEGDKRDLIENALRSLEQSVPWRRLSIEGFDSVNELLEILRKSTT